MARGPLTEFGKVLNELAARKKEDYTWQAIADRLNGVGWEGTRGTISNWAHGRYAADHEMLPYFVLAYDLTDAEQQRLADAFAYGQDPDVGAQTA